MKKNACREWALSMLYYYHYRFRIAFFKVDVTFFNIQRGLIMPLLPKFCLCHAYFSLRKSISIWKSVHSLVSSFSLNYKRGVWNRAQNREAEDLDFSPSSVINQLWPWVSHVTSSGSASFLLMRRLNYTTSKSTSKMPIHDWGTCG